MSLYCISVSIKVEVMIDRFTTLLGKAVDRVCLQSEYKVWNYIVSIIRFHLAVDCGSPSAITRMENLAPNTLNSGFIYLEVFPESFCMILEHALPVIEHCKLSLLANVSQSSDPMLQELALKVDLAWFWIAPD